MGVPQLPPNLAPFFFRALPNLVPIAPDWARQHHRQRAPPFVPRKRLPDWAQSLLKLMSIESMMLSNHLILCCPLLLSPSILLECNPEIPAFPGEEY